MSGVDPDESIAKALESVQLKWCLNAQNKGSFVQIGSHGRISCLIFEKYSKVLIFESIDPKLHRDRVLWIQPDLILFNLPSPTIHIYRRDVSFSAKHWRRVADCAHLGMVDQISNRH